MKTVAVLSRKCGTGKTTLAIHLAVAAEKSRHTTALIDLDPQSSAASWRDIRDDEATAVISIHSNRLPQTFYTARNNGAIFTVIDTAPHTESAALDAANASENVIIPCKPALIDLKAIGSTINIIRLTDVPASVVLNAVPARTNIAEQAREAISHYDVPCAPCDIGSRIAFNHAYTAGLTVQEYEPRGKASKEITKLYSYISKEMGV